VILAVDPGLATCGWAVVRPGTARVIALGVITTERDADIGKNTDRLQRTAHQASVLADLVEEHDVDVIAAEALSFPPKARVAGVSSLCLSWGVLAGISRSCGTELIEVPPKQWQHAVMPGVERIDYAMLFVKLTRFAESQGAARLLAINKGDRSHALDAMGVGIYAALRSEARRVEAIA